MLVITETNNITGQSVIDGVEAAVFTATINNLNPVETNISCYQSNSEVCKKNRELCRADQTEFENYVYALQDTMLGGTENGTE